MGAGTSADAGKAAAAGEPDLGPLPKKVFLKVKIVSAHGLSGPAAETGLLCACKIAGKRTDIQTRPVGASTDPEWHHLSGSVEDYEAGDDLIFEMHEGTKRSAELEDPAGEDAPLGTATLTSETFHYAGFSGELPLQGEFVGEQARLRIKVLAGTKRAVRDHATRSQVLAEALKSIDEQGLDNVEALDRETYIAQNKALSKELRTALRGERYTELKKAYADFRQSVEQARSQSAASSAPAVSAAVQARAEALLQRLAPAAGVIGCEGAASLLHRLVTLLPEDPQRHALHQALRRLETDEVESGNAAQALLEAGAEAAAAEEASAAEGAGPSAGVAAGAVAGVAVGAAAAAAATGIGAGEAAAAVTPDESREALASRPRASLLAAALREVEGERVDEVSALPREEVADRGRAWGTAVQSALPPERVLAFQQDHAAFEECLRKIRPEEPPEEAEEKRSAAAAVFAGQATDHFSDAADRVGEDAAAELLGQAVKLVPEQQARHALRRELEELHRLESSGAGALALPEDETVTKEPAPEGFGAGTLAVVTAAVAGTGAAAAAWWASSFGQAATPSTEPSPAAAEALLAGGRSPATSTEASPPPVDTIRQGDPGKVKVAQALGSLGSAYRNVGKLEEALRQNKQALSIRREDLGDGHPDTAISHNNVAAIYRLQGKLPEAYEHYMKALEIRRRSLGDLSPDTAMSHSNLGAVLLQKGAVDEALEHYSRALEITRAVHGDQHPETAARYNDVGGAFEQKGNLEKALEHLWSALEIQTQTLGDQDSGVGDSYNNVGAVLWQLGRLEEALEFHSRALEIRLATLGEGHSDTALSYGNVGVILEQQGRLAEAVEHQRKALHIRSAVLGEKHHETAASHVNVGVALERQGHYTAALDHFRDASQILKATMGNNHPWTKQAALHLQRCEKASRNGR